jgi:hypothetical protein
MRRLPIVSVLAFVIGCHSSTAEKPASAPSSSAASAAPTIDAAPAAPAHPLPADAAKTLASYGAPHGQPIYVPALGKQPEHWIAFVGGDAAMSAWLVSTGGKRPIMRIDDWPTGVAVRGAYLETDNHGFVGNPHESYAWVFVDSRAGRGQPAGLHGVVRLEIEPEDYSTTVSNVAGLIVPSARVTGADQLKPLLDPLSADVNKAMPLVDDAMEQKLADELGKADPALAAMIPAGGVGVATGWQKLFAKPTGRAKTVDELRPLISGLPWHCDFTGCEAGDAVVTLGVDGDKLVLRDVIVPPAATPPSADARKAVAPSASTASTTKTLRERGILDAKVLAEAPGAHGTIGVYATANDSGLVYRDGDVVATGSANVDASTTADQLRFADVDGDGVPELAAAVKLENGSTRFVFDSVDHGTDPYAGMAAIGAKDLDDAVARAIAPTRPVTVADACALLRSLTSKRALDKQHARMIAFDEPGQPETSYQDMPASPKDLRESVGECDLDCDASRPACTHPVQGPDTEFFLFRWNGDKLELALATVYTGA